jgi:hypothetical protein
MLAARLGLAVLLFVVASAARADTPITLQQSFAGNLDFESTGGNFRTTASGCTVNGTASGALPGLPAGATIRAACLF